MYTQATIVAAMTPSITLVVSPTDTNCRTTQPIVLHVGCASRSPTLLKCRTLSPLALVVVLAAEGL